MAENQEVAKKPKAGIVATAVIAAAIGAAGGNYVGDINQAPADKIDAQVEMSAYQTGVSGVQAVGMTEGMAPHIHVKWDVNSNAKGYNVYVDGKKVNPNPIVVLGSTGRFTATDLQAGDHKVTVSSIGLDGAESAQSDAVDVTVK